MNVMKKGALEKYLIGPSVAAKEQGPNNRGKRTPGASSNSINDPSMLVKSKSEASPQGIGEGIL